KSDLCDESSDLKKKNEEFELLCDIMKVASRHLCDESSQSFFCSPSPRVLQIWYRYAR
ncbi:hypothetical protein U1Q18_018195, partial [Sarracenia purpurea var. burkii]